MLDFFAETGWVNKAPSDDYWYEPRGRETSAGVDVSELSAPQMPTVWACVGKNAKTLGSLPVHVYEKTGARTRQPVDHELNEVLTWAGNQRGTGLAVRSAAVANRLLWGNSVSEVIYANDGKTVREIVPLESRFLRPASSDSGDLLWEHWPENRHDTTLTPARYLHEPGHFTFDGVLGISAVKYCREAIASGRAAEIFGATFFGNGATPGGFLEFPAEMNLSDERQDKLVENFNETWQGPKRAHKIGRLREGVTFKQVGMPPADMQFVELQKFNRIQMCMIFDTPPVMIQELDPGKYTAIEQAMISWVRDSLLPQVTATEAAYKRKFFPDSKLYVKFNLAGLARGDMEARSKFYQAGLQWGWFTQNDIREFEDLDPLEGGDQAWIGMNMMPITSGGKVIPPPQNSDSQAAIAQLQQPVIVVPVNVIGGPKEVDGEAIQRNITKAITASLDHKPADTQAFLPMLEDAAGRIVAREEKILKSALKRHLGDADDYAAWCNTFFRGHTEYVRKAIEPVVCSLERVTGRTATERPADFARHYADHQREIALGLRIGESLDSSYLLAQLKTTYLEEAELCPAN